VPEERLLVFHELTTTIGSVPGREGVVFAQQITHCAVCMPMPMPVQVPFAAGIGQADGYQHLQHVLSLGTLTANTRTAQPRTPSA